MFKKLLVLLSMLAALAMSAVAFAAPAKSHQQMVIDAARAEVPAAAVMSLSVLIYFCAKVVIIIE